MKIEQVLKLAKKYDGKKILYFKEVLNQSVLTYKSVYFWKVEHNIFRINEYRKNILCWSSITYKPSEMVTDFSYLGDFTLLDEVDLFIEML